MVTLDSEILAYALAGLMTLFLTVRNMNWIKGLFVKDEKVDQSVPVKPEFLVNGHKMQHESIDRHRSEIRVAIKALSDAQLIQGEILKQHETRLNDGKAEFKQICEDINNIEKHLAVIATKVNC